MTHSPISRRTVLKGLSSLTAVNSIPFSHSANSTAQLVSPPKAIGQPFPAGVELPSTPPQAPNSESIGVALVGLGLYALGKMAPALTRSKHCHLAALVSGNPSKAARVAKAYGVETDAIYSYENFDEILKDDRVNAINIVLPSGLHAEWTEKAFAANKHVLCEKPMALSSVECDRMINASKKAGKKLMIAYRCHFEPNNLNAIELMKQKAVGDIQVIRTDQHYTIGNVTPSSNWRANRALAGGGALEDYGLYGLQAALYLTGEMPTSVSATISTPADNPAFSEIINLQTSRLSFPSGAIAQLASSYDASWHDRVEVRGNRGVMQMDPATAYSGIQTKIIRSANDREIVLDPSGQFSAMLDHFGVCIKQDTPVITDGAMGRRDIRLIEAIYSSALLRREISLRPDGSMKNS